MSRRGARPGAGLKPLGVNKATQQAQDDAQQGGVMPLDYMLRVMRDENADADRRDDMAKTAAPYVHGKLGSAAPADPAAPLFSLLTGMRQSLATKLDRIAGPAPARGPSDESDG